MDSFQEFIESHPLTTEEVRVFYDFLYHLYNMDNEERVGQVGGGRSVGEVMDILEQFYE